ncbi:BREX-2 system adenine-specific DNA-methyltransferase PglX [Streptomyces asoensis]|uniref:BREX-2 system adenine-specific DNA-methyltransferase PglX n=1 Tax=Streptomyces asoensis TaxID=249586 RepID=UPI003404BA5C
MSGPGDRLGEAQDRHDAYFRRNPSKNDRDWLEESFAALAASHRTVAGLFDRAHHPLYEVTPSYEAATALLAFWRARDADGEIVHDFTDAELDTRFLGDLYQDLSEHARKTYALLQTPVFVEEFILDLTLEPAVEEFGLTPAWKYRPGGWDGEVRADEPGGEDVVRGLRCIDPASGSGHFLLGMLERLLGKWREAEPGTEAWVLVRRALESVHGADKNPFAVAIARFRLLVAALKAGGVRELSAAPGLPIRVAVADSLLHGRGAETVTEALDTLFAEEGPFYYVVVGNPPYITVKDANENKNYKAAYDACYRQYALSVPFAQRIFELAVRAGGSIGMGGYWADRGQLLYEAGVRWWTWAGHRANATLAASLSPVNLRHRHIDDRFIRLRDDLTPQVWQAAVADAEAGLTLPEVDVRAVRGLKFAEALPQRLAEATLAARLADEKGARAVLAEPVRFLIRQDD